MAPNAALTTLKSRNKPLTNANNLHIMPSDKANCCCLNSGRGHFSHLHLNSAIKAKPPPLLMGIVERATSHIYSVYIFRR